MVKMETPESYRQKVIDDVINGERLRIAASFPPIKKWREFKKLEKRVQEMKRMGILEMLIEQETDGALKEQLVQLQAVVDSKVDELTTLKQFAIEREEYTYPEADLEQLKREIAANEVKLREAYAKERKGDVEIYANIILGNERMIKENNDYNRLLIDIKARAAALDSEIKQTYREALHITGVGKARMDGIIGIRRRMASSPSISTFLETLKKREKKFKEELEETKGIMKRPRLEDELGTDARLAMNEKIEEVLRKA